MAITSARAANILHEMTPTRRDPPDIVNAAKLATRAEALHALIVDLERWAW